MASVSVNFFKRKTHPTVGSSYRDHRSPELKCQFFELSKKILEIFDDDVDAATVFVDRTLFQMRCSFAPCMVCCIMTKGNLMCGACQRTAVLGVDANLPPKESRQQSYFANFETQILERAKKHKQRCFVAAQRKNSGAA